MRIVVLIIAVVGSFAVAAQDIGDDYKRLTPSCHVCVTFQELVKKHDDSTSPRTHLDIAFKIARVIDGLSLTGLSIGEQRRTLYYAINSALEVFDDDFDAETLVGLLDVFQKFPKPFDDVFWRFPLVDQKKIVTRMGDIKKRQIRPNANLPVVKELE